MNHDISDMATGGQAVVGESYVSVTLTFRTGKKGYDVLLPLLTLIQNDAITKELTSAAFSCYTLGEDGAEESAG